MLSSFAVTSSPQAEIVEIVLRNGWDYMKTLLTGGTTGEPDLPKNWV